jgi:hypothetical protein
MFVQQRSGDDFFGLVMVTVYANGRKSDKMW